MQLWADLVLLGASLLVLTFLPPALHYQKTAKLSKKHSSPSDHGYIPEITVFLPMREESQNAQRKIDEIFSMKYPRELIKLLIIDSDSKDGTFEIANEYLQKEYPDYNFQVIRTKETGKSIAVNKAIDHIDTPYFVMMDSDSSCPPDSLRRIMQWFVDPLVGAVCAQQSPTIGIKIDPYRFRFNQIRSGESSLHSTPIFEGSLCAFRTTAIGENRVISSINADDSQLAMIAISNGFRSIMDSELSFFDLNEKISRKRRVRRAQGLSRALWANRRLRRMGKPIGNVIGHALYFHIFMPWLAVFSLISIFFSLLLASISGTDYAKESLFILVSFTFISSQINNNVKSLFSGISVLLESHVRLIFGQRLQVWVPDRTSLLDQSEGVTK